MKATQRQVQAKGMGKEYGSRAWVIRGQTKVRSIPPRAQAHSSRAQDASAQTSAPTAITTGASESSGATSPCKACCRKAVVSVPTVGACSSRITMPVSHAVENTASRSLSERRRGGRDFSTCAVKPSSGKWTSDSRSNASSGSGASGDFGELSFIVRASGAAFLCREVCWS